MKPAASSCKKRRRALEINTGGVERSAPAKKKRFLIKNSAALSAPKLSSARAAHSFGTRVVFVSSPSHPTSRRPTADNVISRACITRFLAAARNNSATLRHNSVLAASLCYCWVCHRLLVCNRVSTIARAASCMLIVLFSSLSSN
jgi:hypothetical protein